MVWFWHWLAPIYDLLLVLTIFYVVSATIVLLLDNRSVASTFAWLLWFFVFPVGGLLIYLFFGRDWKAFSNQRKLMRQELGGYLLQRIALILAIQPLNLERVKAQKQVSYHRLLHLVRRNSLSALTCQNEVTILQDGREKYPRLLEDIRNAHHSIHLQYFIWQTDQFTIPLKDLLIAKVQEGVQVRLLYDALGCFGTMKGWYKRELEQGGVDVREYSPIWHFHTIGYRNHRKIAVIDGQIAYTGGLNIGQEHLDHWRDTHLRVVGEASRILQAMFSVDWYNATREKLDDAALYPPITETVGYSPVQIITSGPDSEWNAIRQLYFFMIVSAQRAVFIQSPFLILDDTVEDAMKAAALAGVDVRLMITRRNWPNFAADWAARTYAHSMSKAGVKVFLYQQGYLHAKTMSIDGEICSIGSANLDIRSFNTNYELNAVLYDAALAKQLEADFLRDLTNCTEFHWRDYERRSLFVRLRDSIARLLSPLQ